MKIRSRKKDKADWLICLNINPQTKYYWIYCTVYSLETGQEWKNIFQEVRVKRHDRLLVHHKKNWVALYKVVTEKHTSSLKPNSVSGHWGQGHMTQGMFKINEVTIHKVGCLEMDLHAKNILKILQKHSNMKLRSRLHFSSFALIELCKITV